MSDRLEITKTYKLYINGAFPRSESGRTASVPDRAGAPEAHASVASRKDLRAAVEAARGAFGKWSASTAVLRGQILYRLAEMIESRRATFLDALGGAADAPRELDTSIDRLVTFAGWSDKYQQVLGAHNPVAGAYDNFTVPEPTGVCTLFSPDSPALLGLVSLLAPAACAGNTCVLIVPIRSAPVALSFAEACATSDIPAGVVNVLTGGADELASWAAEHRDVDAIVSAGTTDAVRTTLRAGAAENLKRVTALGETDWHDDACESPEAIARTLEYKTAWHPTAM